MSAEKGQDNHLKVLELAVRAEREAGLLVTRKRWLHMVTLCVTIAGVLAQGFWAYLLLGIAAAAECIAWTLHGRLSALHEGSRTGKRLALLGDALGGADAVNVAYSESALGPLLKTGPEEDVAGYYGSSKPRGTDRLRENLQESAFLSQAVLHSAASEALRRWLIVSGIVATAVFVAAPFASAAVVVGVSRGALVGLTLLASAEDLWAWRRFGTAAKRVEEIDRQLSRGGLDDVGVMSLYAEYAVAMSGAPPLPEKAYRRVRSQMAEAWARRMVQTLP